MRCRQAAVRRSAPVIRARQARGTAGRAAGLWHRSPRSPSRAATAGRSRPSAARRRWSAGRSRDARSTGTPRPGLPRRRSLACRRPRSTRARQGPSAVPPRQGRSHLALCPAMRARGRPARTAARRRSRRAARRRRSSGRLPRPASRCTRRSTSRRRCPNAPAADPVPVAAASDSGADGYTSYCVAGYTTPRIWTDEVRIWETTFAVVTVGGGAAVSAAICCGDFTNEAPISPPIASRAAPPATQNRARRRRASRDPRTACRVPSLGLPSVAGEPSCVTRYPSASPTTGLSEEAGRRLSPAA